MAADESAKPTTYHQRRDAFRFRSGSSASHLGAYQIMVGDEFLTFMTGYRRSKCLRMQKIPCRWFGSAEHRRKPPALRTKAKKLDARYGQDAH